MPMPKSGRMISRRRFNAASQLASGDRMPRDPRRGDQLGDLRRPARTAKRDAAERFHQFLACRMRVSA
jgi:hypothetical protein